MATEIKVNVTYRGVGETRKFTATTIIESYVPQIGSHHQGLDKTILFVATNTARNPYGSTARERLYYNEANQQFRFSYLHFVTTEAKYEQLKADLEEFGYVISDEGGAISKK